MSSRREVRFQNDNNTQPIFEIMLLNEYAERSSVRFRRIEKRVKYGIKHNLGTFSNLYEVSEAVDNEFNNLMQTHLQNAGGNDLFSVSINHEDLDSDIYLPPRKKITFNKEDFLDKIFDTSQSNRTFLMNGELYLTIMITKSIQGSKYRKAPQTLPERSRKKLSVIVIRNKDKNCFLRALYTGIYYCNKRNSNQREWRYVREDRFKTQERGARALAKIFNILWDAEVALQDISLIQANHKLRSYQIIIIDSLNPKYPLFKGPQKKKKIFIEYTNTVANNGHYNLIKKINAYMGYQYVCEDCFHVSNTKSFHKCKAKCNRCYISKECNIDNPIECSECNRTFNNRNCFLLHKEGGTCRSFTKCIYCLRELVSTDAHDCETKICTKCSESYVTQPHYCFAAPLDINKILRNDQLPKVFVAYDIETTQIIIDNKLTHIPNLLISQTVCDECWDKNERIKILYPCPKCGVGSQTFFGTNCINLFGNYLFKHLATYVAQFNGLVYAFAHNAKGFDAHFILQDLWGRSYTDTKVILKGRKILRLSVGNVRLIDSYAFFMQPLSSLPKAFSLNTSVRKGYFPHLFNKPENYLYEGPLPTLDMYSVEYMKPAQARELRQWHQEKVNEQYVFNFMREFLAYCQSDVDILIKSIMVFRDKVISITDIDPFTTCFTIASLGMEIYRAKFLKSNQIGITPVNNYSNSRTFSKVANCWLDWKQNEFGKEIIREYNIGIFFTDGYIKEDKHVFEFFGCRYHGCYCTYITNRDTFIHQFKKTPNELYNTVQDKLNHYTIMGLQTTYIWECEYKQMKRQNNVFKEYCDERYKYYQKLEKHGGAVIRESFFGGNTNNLKFFYETKGDEEIKYLDFNSLYPDVLKNRFYPVGHPNVIREHFDYTLHGYFGFVKCKLLPPTKEYFPPIPFRIRKKLMFPLCNACATQNQKFNCNHSTKEKILINTWTTEELKVALIFGYKILEIYEVLHYTQKSIMLFRDFINMWYKIKTEASGFPSWCDTEEKKLLYIQLFYQREGILLEYDKIIKNETIRWIAKIFLNSNWGKWCQHPNMPITELIQSYEEYFNIVNDETKELKGELMVNEDVLLVTWVYKDETSATAKNYNLAIPSFVTAYARLKLFWLIQKIEAHRPHSVLYHDTDSVMYVQKKGENFIETGDFLGQLKDEFEDLGDATCTKFASLGPKNYGYEIKNANGTTSAKLKVKGLCLNENTLDIVNFRKVLEMAKEFSSQNNHEEILCPQFCIETNEHHNLHSRYFNKVYRATSDKRISNENTTLPFGYVTDE